MKRIKIIALAILAVVLPHLIALVSVAFEFGFLLEICVEILYAYPLYLPAVFIVFAIQLFKATDEIFSPLLILNVLLVFVEVLFTIIMLENSERSLADAGAVLLLIGPLFYSVPASFIAAMIYRRNKSKDELQNSGNETEE